MGVTGLWNIVTPLSKVTSLAELRGKTVAIDLSGWIVDSQTVGTNDACPNVHLRNIFFRTSALLLSGINPVFVLEGKAPELKHDVIRERNKARKDTNHRSQRKPGKGGRGNLFKATAKQCEIMLKLMGLTCVQAEGEAEAMCAYLDADGLVDGCISQDSDCFLYGAKKVYRNFSLHGKNGFGSSVEEYTLESIERISGLGRNKMIALALLCGCDYDTGVPGVGKERALQLLKAIDDKSILKRFESWGSVEDIIELRNPKAPRKDITDEEKKRAANELLIKRKCMAVENFPNQELMDEFLVRKGSIPKKINKWNKPDIIELVLFMEKKIQWTAEYALEKIFPLLPRWQVENPTIDCLDALEPKQILKKRNIQSINYFEIEWDVNSKCYIHVDDENKEYNYDKNLLTIEPQELVRQIYPELVESFEDTKNAKKTKVGKKKPAEKNNIEKPIKNSTKTNDKKSNKKIFEYLDKNLITIEDESSEQNKATKPKTPKKCANRKRSSAKADITVSDELRALGESDFDTDVEEDDLEMSMIVARVCGSEANLEKHQWPTLKENKSPRRRQRITPIISPTPKKFIAVEINKTTSNSFIDLDDDDIPYIPLTLRIKK